MARNTPSAPTPWTRAVLSGQSEAEGAKPMEVVALICAPAPDSGEVVST